ADVLATQAVVTFDRGMPATRAKARAIVEKIAGVFAACDDFIETYDAQVTPMLMLAAVDGQPAFPTLASAPEALQHLLGRLAEGHHWQMALLQLTSHAPTVGELNACLDAVNGTKPFPQRLIERHIASFRPEPREDEQERNAS